MATGTRGASTTGTTATRPSDFVNAWKHTHDLFVAAGATNVKWVWSPNVRYGSNYPFANLYPGSAYVDWVALDGYNWGGQVGGHPGWQSMASIFLDSYNQVLGYGKPIVFAETASAEAGGTRRRGSRHSFFTDIPKKMPRRPRRHLVQPERGDRLPRQLVGSVARRVPADGGIDGVEGPHPIGIGPARNVPSVGSAHRSVLSDEHSGPDRRPALLRLVPWVVSLLVLAGVGALAVQAGPRPAPSVAPLPTITPPPTGSATSTSRRRAMTGRAGAARARCGRSRPPPIARLRGPRSGWRPAPTTASRSSSSGATGQPDHDRRDGRRDGRPSTGGSRRHHRPERGT